MFVCVLQYATTIQRLGIQQMLHTTVQNALTVTFQNGTRTPTVSAATSLRMKARVAECAADAMWQEEEEEAAWSCWVTACTRPFTGSAATGAEKCF